MAFEFDWSKARNGNILSCYFYVQERLKEFNNLEKALWFAGGVGTACFASGNPFVMLFGGGYLALNVLQTYFDLYVIAIPKLLRFYQHYWDELGDPLNLELNSLSHFENPAPVPMNPSESAVMIMLAKALAPYTVQLTDLLPFDPKKVQDKNACDYKKNIEALYRCDDNFLNVFKSPPHGYDFVKIKKEVMQEAYKPKDEKEITHCKFYSTRDYARSYFSYTLLARNSNNLLRRMSDTIFPCLKEENKILQFKQ